MSQSFLVSLCIVALSFGVHGRQTTVTPKPRFVPLRPAAATSSVELTLGLPATNIEGLHAALYDVSDPKSANYGRHLSKAEVEAFVAPKPDSVQAVNDWLAQHDVHPEVISPSGDMLRINIPVPKANALLGANFTVFKDQHSGTTLVRTLSVTIPDDVDSHLQFMYPTTQFIMPVNQSPRFEAVNPPKASTRRQSLPSICSVDVDPECLEDFYHIPTAPANASGNSLAVSGYLNEIASEDDLEISFLAFRPDVTTTPEFSVVSVDGGVTSGSGTLEASLDIQYTVGIATGVPTTFYSVGNPFADGFIDLVNFLLAQDELPLVLTTSYGFNESDFTGAEALAESFCNAYAQLGARGTSVFFCSGDNGVYSFSFNSLCDATDFGPTFPSTCPFLTSVGGTQGFSPEVAASFSGGGFSNMFARPDYQAAAVDSYLTRLGGQFAGLFNQSGRAFPDVSAQSVDFITRISGGSSALNDITSGSNPGCGAQGFPTMDGWDPVTGLGTPDYEKLLALVTGLGA
ncbi:hypothetical protein BN946_scf184801.g14 [Trametes cinnabarina]|uniref:Peptidase S53 domain-containing protein n=1 Tax=Pycnoporus cinnabarinus TaxID=5643 RepID=A0A060S8N9_PYCCI|nr:hypothetical protein BN946_scf184801.g14 [Trametes cinnabarina]